MKKVFVFVLMLLGTTLCHAAESYPSHSVRIIVPFSPGGGSDFSARLIAAELSKELGQSFVVENRTGAGGTLGAGLVAKAAPDGHTLLLLESTFPIAQSIYKSLPFSLKDFTPITHAIGIPQAFAVAPSLKVDTMKGFIDLLKANPGKYNYGSAGTGTSNHVYVELFKLDTKTDFQHIPFNGGAASLTGLVSGQVQMIFSTLPTVTGFAKSGDVKVLAVATGTGRRASSLPDVPTMSEVGLKDLDSALWYGFAGPAGMPDDVTEKLYSAIQKALESPTVQAGIAAQGSEPIRGVTPKQFTTVIANEISQWKKVVEEAKIPRQ
jgi:tripartite-type tricarboxylate transporter receptor subunit TctC